jgi:hypothetical protein
MRRSWPSRSISTIRKKIKDVKLVRDKFIADQGFADFDKKHILTHGTLKKQKEETLMTALFCMVSIAKYMRMCPKEINNKASVVCKTTINAKAMFFYCMLPCNLLENYQVTRKKVIRVFTAVRTSCVSQKHSWGK